MPVIIDGNNLIGSAPEIALEDADARKKMVELAREYQRAKRTKVVLVFDGEPDAALQTVAGEVKFSVRFPSMGKSADDVIKTILKGYHDMRNVLVVSSDRELKQFARHRGAKTVNSLEFFFKLKKVSRMRGKQEALQKRIDVNLSRSEVDRWMKIFGPD